MILTLFIIIMLFGLILFYVGLTQESFPAAYLSMFVFMIIGLFLLSEGLSIETGSLINTTATLTTVDATYTTYTAANNIFVSLLGNFFFYGAFGLTLLTTVFALRGHNEYEDN